MNKWWWLLLLTACWIGAGFVIFDFQPTQASDSSRLSGRAERIVSLAPNLTEILFALGLEEQTAGVTVYSDYPPAATRKPKVGTFWQPNIEAIIAARPDLVVALGFAQQRSLAERLRRMNYDCLTVNIEKVAELFEAIERTGEATGRQNEADELTNDIRAKLSRLSAMIGTEEDVRVLWVVQREPLRVAGRDTFVNEMIELAGGANAIGPTVHKYPPIGAEQVISCGADVIIEPSMYQKDLAAQRQKALQYWSKYENVPAVAEGRVYVIEGDMVSRLSPRLYEGIETIAGCLRPGLLKSHRQ
jgi:iron complex transport system substrate-binding protein